VISVDADFVRDTLADLVAINSVNPTLDPSSPGEVEAAAYVGRVLAELGLDVTAFETEPRRVTTTGRIKGTGGGRSLMLNAHIDTVGVEGMESPFTPRVEDGRLYGRGSYDMKGALAACIGAAKALREAGRPLAGDVVVAAVADEEYGSLGTRDLVARMPVDGAIVTEPTHLRVCLAHKGFVWLRVRTQGRAAHGSRFDEGVDANMMMGRVLTELAALESGLRTGPAHPLVGPPSLHAPLIHGGTGISTYAAVCELEIERRTVPGETVDQVESEVSAMLARLRATDASFSATHEVLVSRDPFEVAPEASIVQAVEQAARSLLGREPERVGDTPWMDSALLAAAGVDTVVIGPAGGGAHSNVEWVDLQSVVDLASILVEAALEYCA
jgi:acetylornithine deacetylase